MQNYLQQPQQYGNYRPMFYKALPIANEAVSLFDWVNGKGKGAKWSVQDIKAVSGIDFDTKDYYELDFAYVMNMLWSDYCDIFTEPVYYVKMVRNYLEDADYAGDASERAYKNTKKRIKYFKENE